MKLFILLPRVPYPLEKGDKLRAFHQIRYLSEKCELHLCCLNDSRIHPEAIDSLKPYCKSITIIKLNKLFIILNIFIAFLKGLPLQAGYFYSYRAKRKIDNLIDSIRPDHIYCQLIRTALYLKNTNTEKTIDFQDAFSAGAKRRKKTSNIFYRPLLNIEAARLRKFEDEIFYYFNNHTIISSTDREVIGCKRRKSIHVIHNGVDTDYFKYKESEKINDILFSGNMKYPPNIAGANFLVKKILPILKKKFPDIKVIIAGANPSRNVRALKNINIDVTGWVDDIREIYSISKIFVAPMLIGTGLQNKLLEAMAMKIPCITSTLANDSLKALPGKDILICNTAEEYSKAIDFLIQNPEKAAEIAENGYKFVKQNYNWETETEKLFMLFSSEL